MVRDLPSFNLRMPAELRTRVEKEAEISGRSLNAEICRRLQLSLEKQARASRGYGVEEPPPEATPISDSERTMLAVFRRWTAEKQLAFLTLFK